MTDELCFTASDCMITLVKALAIVSFPDVTRETNPVNLLFQRIIIDRCESQNINFLADFAKHLHIDVSIFLEYTSLILVKHIEDRDRKAAEDQK